MIFYVHRVLESLLRGDGHGQKGRAGREGIVQYGHQGGGQDHTHQLIVPYNNTIMEGEIRTTPILTNHVPPPLPT